MAKTLTPQHLYNELAQECELAMQLVDVLLEEQSSLIRMTTQHLPELALRKEGLMFELEKRFHANLQYAVAAGFESSLTGLNAWIEQQAEKHLPLQGTFSTLKTTLTQAQRLNISNGELVEEQLAGIQARISILTAASVQTQQTTGGTVYGPKGGLANPGGSTQVKPRAVIR